jgi:hypothetical protein
MHGVTRPASEDLDPPTVAERRGDRQVVKIGLLAVLVFGVSLWQNLSAVSESQFHPDESRWLNRAFYLEAFLHPTSDVWEDRYLTRGQPPMGSYITGLGLLLQGRDLTTNGPWDFHYGNEATLTWNAVKGNVPDPADLMAARRTSAAIGALTCLVLFLIVTSLSNWIGGAIAALAFAFNPLQIYLASLGVSDAAFTFFVALATLAIVVLATKPSWKRTAALGVILGLGASTKLSPVFVAAALAIPGLLILADGMLRRFPLLGRAWTRWSRVDWGANRRLGWMLVALPAIAFATFIASYPYLWPDPVGRTQLLLDFRQHEMENQARIWPSSAIDSRVEALERTWQNLENRYSASGRAIELLGRGINRDWSGKGFDVPLSLAGLAILALLVIRRGFPSRHFLALALIGAQSAAILGNLRVDFNRYYLPLAFVCAIGIGILAGQIAVWTLPRLGRRQYALTSSQPSDLRPRRLQPAARRSTVADG